MHSLSVCIVAIWYFINLLLQQCHWPGLLTYSVTLKYDFNYVQSRLAITRIGYNAVGRGPRISAARGEIGATANNNAVINCHLFL